MLTILLFAKISKGAGGYEPGSIIFDTTISIVGSEWTVLKNKIAGTNNRNADFK